MSLSHSPGIVTSGLTLCIDAANAKSYLGSGTTWSDISGNGINATLTNGPMFNAGNNGTISFDGINDFAVMGRVPGTGTATASCSWCVWVKPYSTAGNIMSMSIANPQNNWNMPPIAATGQSFRGKVWGGSYLYSSSTYALNSWYYVVLVFRYSSTSSERGQFLYVNGALQASQTSMSYDASGSDNFIFLAQSNPGADNTGMFSGEISNFAIYGGKALTASEVSQNFNALRGRFGI